MADAVPPVADLLASLLGDRCHGMTKETFFATHWQRVPLVMASPSSSHTQPAVLSLTALERVLSAAAVRPSGEQHGTPIPPPLSAPLLSPAYGAETNQQKATVVVHDGAAGVVSLLSNPLYAAACGLGVAVQHAELCEPSLWAMCRHLEGAAGFPVVSCDVEVTATGSGAALGHVGGDASSSGSIDVLLLQCHGEQEVTLMQTTHSTEPRCCSTAVVDACPLTPAAAFTATLRQGDALYVPAGWTRRSQRCPSPAASAFDASEGRSAFVAVRLMSPRYSVAAAVGNAVTDALQAAARGAPPLFFLKDAPPSAAPAAAISAFAASVFGPSGALASLAQPQPPRSSGGDGNQREDDGGHEGGGGPNEEATTTAAAFAAAAASSFEAMTSSHRRERDASAATALAAARGAAGQSRGIEGSSLILWNRTVAFVGAEMIPEPDTPKLNCLVHLKRAGQDGRPGGTMSLAVSKDAAMCLGRLAGEHASCPIAVDGLPFIAGAPVGQVAMAAFFLANGTFVRVS